MDSGETRLGSGSNSGSENRLGEEIGLESEILLTDKSLLEILKENLCPEYVRDREAVLLTAPWDDRDFRVGVYLYDIQDYSIILTEGSYISDEERRFPPKAVELSYMIFCNEKQRFGGVQREQVHMVLNEIIRLVYDNPLLQREDGENVQISFLREDADFKLRLWGGFDKPLQPAVYVKAMPVLVTSARIRKAARVRENLVDVGEMQDTQQGEEHLTETGRMRDTG